MKKGDIGFEGPLDIGRVDVNWLTGMVQARQEIGQEPEEFLSAQTHIQLLLLIEIRDLLENIANGENAPGG